VAFVNLYGLLKTCVDFCGQILTFAELCGLLWILKTCNSDFCEFF
jgi:hypothetical protein